MKKVIFKKDYKGYKKGRVAIVSDGEMKELEEADVIKGKKEEDKGKTYKTKVVKSEK